MENNHWASVNKALWNAKTEVHLHSDFYDQQAFLKGKNTLNDIELALLGDIKGKRILHLQCHFGQDSMSLSRMGASVTGVDMSDVSIQKATEIAASLQLDTDFICCNVYDLEKHLDQQYDIIFTSYGTIGWLPDMERYFTLIKQFLKPVGQFILVEFHPFMWIWDDDFKQIQYSYFNRETIELESSVTYTNDTIAQHKEISWNHDLSEVFQAAKHQQLQVVDFQEYDYSPYNCFSHMVKTEKGFQIKGMEGKIPMVYSLVLTTA